MALNASKAKSNGGDFVEQELLDPGVYPARVVQVIDFGLQAQRPFQGKDKPPVNEIGLTYELSDEFMLDKDGNVDESKPRWVSENFPLHNLKADRAKSTIRYTAIDPNGIYGGDFSQLVDTPINVALVHNKKADKTYVNVANVSSMRSKDADKLPPLKNKAKVFDLDDPDLDVFAAFPDWIQTKIKSNLNYNGSPLQKLINGEDAPKNSDKKQEKRDRKNSETAEENSEESSDKIWD